NSAPLQAPVALPATPPLDLGPQVAPTGSLLVAPPTLRSDAPGQNGQDERPRLLIQDEGQTHEAVLGGQALTLGRAPDNDIVLHSRFVSAHHAKIEPDAGAHRIVDIGSTNGLLFEGKRLPVSSPLGLADGDVLRIGDPATGNFVTLTYRNPGSQRAAQAATV